MTNPPIFDGHNDALSSARNTGRNLLQRSEEGHLDLPRAAEGGFGGGFFACYVANPPKEWSEEIALFEGNGGYEVAPPPPLDPAHAAGVTRDLAASLFRLQRQRPDRLRVVRSAAEIEECLHSGIVAAVLHIEGAEAIDEDLAALEILHQAGLRSLGPVWSRDNAFGHGVPFRFPGSPDTGPGLTPAGKRLVRRCNELRILVDLSHLNERGFWDVAELSDAPLVTTHSNAHALCPSTRNLTDPQLAAIRDSGGMVGVNFAVSFLRADGHNDPDTPLAEVVRHIDYLVERMGIEHVGFGSDLDGATMPSELGDASGLPRLLESLHERGYEEDDLRRLAHDNWLRVLRRTWGD